MVNGSIPEADMDELDVVSAEEDGIIAIAKAKRTPSRGDRAVPLADYRVEVGSTGLNVFGGRVTQEFLTELQGLKGYRTYDEMRKNDPVIGGLLFATEQAIRRVKWFEEPQKEGDDHLKAVEFLNQCRFDMSHSWNDLISEALTFLPFGWSFFETVYKERRGRLADPSSRFDDGKVGWRKFGYRPPDTLEKWDIDDNGGIRGMWQRDIRRPMAPVYIPIEKAVLFRTKRERNNPEGVSILRNSYKPYFFKKELEKFEAIALERTGAGIPVIKLPLGFTQADLAMAKNVVRRIRVDEQMGVTLPPGWELQLLRPEGRAETGTYEMAINRYSYHILMSLLLTFIALGANSVGSFALVRAQQDFFRLALVGWVTNMEETLNMFAVDPLFAINSRSFSEDVINNPPRLQTTDIGEYDLEVIGNFLQFAGKTGFLTPDDHLENYFRRIAGFPELKMEEEMETSREDMRLSATGAKKPELSMTEIQQERERQEATFKQRELMAKRPAGPPKPYGNPNARSRSVQKNDAELRKMYREMSYGQRPIDTVNVMQVKKLIDEALGALNGIQEVRDDYGD